MREIDLRCHQGRVMDTEEWHMIHACHGKPSKRLNEHQPPKGTYTIYTLFCPCGAKHTLIEAETTNEPTS